MSTIRLITEPICPLAPAELRVLAAYVEAETVAGTAAALGRTRGGVTSTLNKMRARTGWGTNRLIYEATRNGWLQVND